MKKTLLFLSLFLFLQCKPIEHTLEHHAPSNNKAIPPSYDLAIAHSVLDQLLSAMSFAGIESKPKIVLEFVVKGGPGIYYLASKNTIYIESVFYKIIQESSLAKKGKLQDALAFYIGHELGHFEQDVACPGVFIANPKPEICDLNKTDFLSQEVVCDHFGGFASHLANFETLDIIEDIFDVYENFNRTASGLEHRKCNASNLKSEIQELITLFDDGNTALINGYFRKARTNYETILESYEGVEVINNLAVADMYEILLIGHPKFLDIYWPFEVDVHSRLENIFSMSYQDKEDRRKELLSKVVNSLLGIIEHEKGDYPVAHINLAIAYSLDESFDKAQNHAQKAIELSSRGDFPILAAKGRIAKGIAHLLAKENAEARAYFEQVLGNENGVIREMGKENLALVVE